MAKTQLLKSILVCLDGSLMAEQIIPSVKDEINKGFGKLILMYILDQAEGLPPSSSPASSDTSEDIIKRKKEALNYLERIAAPLRENGITVECQVIQGQPAESIVEFGEKNRVGMIALTAHGEGGLGRLVFGSTAIQVLRESSRPILIIKPERNNPS